MAFSRSVFIILLLSVVCNASNVPAFLWGDLAEPNLKSNPLTATTAPEFSDILSNELAQEPFTAIFVEPTLSIEDFSRRNALGETSFPYLYQNLRKSVYLPSVDNAMLAIELLDDPKKVDRVQLTEDGLSQAIVPSSGKFLIIYMNDARPDESRAELLRRHNDIMRDTISELKMHNDKVVGVYTANGPSWTIPHSRLRRQAESNASSDYVLDGLRLYAKNIKLVDGATTTSLHGLTSSSSVFNAENLTQTTTLNFDATSIALNFKGTGGYWYFESVTLNPGTATPEEFSPAEEVFALIDFSYRCGPNVTFVYGNSTKHMFFEDLKIQPVFHSTNESNQVVFGDSFNCVGFFSAPIWSSLFVVFILLSITFYGIMMMMDIRTMDRFDDPKGKTITINAAE